MGAMEHTRMVVDTGIFIGSTAIVYNLPLLTLN